MTNRYEKLTDLMGKVQNLSERIRLDALSKSPTKRLAAGVKFIPEYGEAFSTERGELCTEFLHHLLTEFYDKNQINIHRSRDVEPVDKFDLIKLPDVQHLSALENHIVAIRAFQWLSNPKFMGVFSYNDTKCTQLLQQFVITFFPHFHVGKMQ